MSKRNIHDDVRFFFGDMGRHFVDYPELLLNLQEEMVAALFLQFKKHNQFDHAQDMAVALSQLNKGFFDRVLRFMNPEDRALVQVRFPKS